MAKRFTDPVVIIPWFDNEGMKQRSHLMFKGTVDKRRMRRELFRFMRVNFNCKPHSLFVNGTLDANIRAFCTVMNPAMRIASRKTGLDQAIEEWLQRIQDEPDESEGCTESKEVLPGSPEEPMPVMQEGLNGGPV